MEGCGAAIITGGTKGIGLASAQEMLALGYRQFILGYQEDDNAAQKAKVDLEEKPGVKVVLVKGDITDKTTTEAIFRAVEEQFDGQLFAIIHSAGKYIKLDSKDPEKTFDEYIGMYGKALWRLIERGVPYMEKSPHGGRIIAVSNPGVNLMSTPRVWYFLPGCGKATLEYTIRSYAVKLAPAKITCNVVIPGITGTDGWSRANMSAADVEELAARMCPMEAVIQPRYVGAAIAFLASEKAKFITGAMLPVDGGLLFV